MSDLEALQDLARMPGELAEARALLAAIVGQYDALPDGPLGKGFTNGPFLAAREFLLRSTRPGDDDTPFTARP